MLTEVASDRSYSLGTIGQQFEVLFCDSVIGVAACAPVSAMIG